VLRARKPDVVLAHGAAATLVSVLATPRRPPAIVFQTIVGMAPQAFAGAQRWGWSLAVRRIDAVVALTGELGDELRRLGYRGPVWPIPNARRSERFVDLDRMVEAQRLRAEIGVPSEAVLIGLVGFLVEQKRPERAVELVAGLRDRQVDVHLVVAGTGPLAPLVRQKAESLGVSDRVWTIGHRDDVPRVLAGLDLLVLTSDDEGVPGIVIEAAMAGCPVVTFPLGGVADVVADGATGRVLATASVPELIDVTAALVADGERRRAMGDEARARSTQWAMETVATRYEEELTRLVTSQTGATCTRGLSG
jgi:glycosyltransferase involved in cell wall biosynthesis